MTSAKTRADTNKDSVRERVLVPVVNRVNEIRRERGIAQNVHAAFDRLLTGADSAVITGQL